MKEYAQKPEAVSRTPDADSRSSRQPSWEVILQTYAPKRKMEEGDSRPEGEGDGQGKDSLNSPRGVMQRAVENKKWDVTFPHAVAVEEFFNSFDRQASEAFRYVVSVPGLGALAGLNGYTRLWMRLWTDYLGGGRPPLMAAAFGYVIETLVCHSLSGFRPAPPAGYNFVMQLVAGGTRPDVVLMQGTTQIAWLDLTASGSTDHIFAKEGWNEKISMYAEVTYPSLTPEHMELMRANRMNTGFLSPEEFEERVKAERIIYARNKKHWENLGKTHFSRTSCSREIPHPRLWLDDQFRNFIKSKLQRYFGIPDIDMKMIPSILIAMRVDPVTWKYTTGYSQSEGAGDAWLTDHAPAPVDMEEMEVE